MCVYRRAHAALVYTHAEEAIREGLSPRLWAVDGVEPELSRWTVGTGPGPFPLLVDRSVHGRPRSLGGWIVIAPDHALEELGSLAKLLGVARVHGLDVVFVAGDDPSALPSISADGPSTVLVLSPVAASTLFPFGRPDDPDLDLLAGPVRDGSIRAGGVTWVDGAPSVAIGIGTECVDVVVAPGSWSDVELPVYCVNLASRPDRRARMTRRFTHHGLIGSAKFVTAIPATAASIVREYQAGERRYAHRAAEIACLRSHLTALQRFLIETPPEVRSVVVCEDDVLLHDDFNERLAGTLHNLPPDAEACLLSYLVWDWEEGHSWAGRDPEMRNLRRLAPANTWGNQMYWMSRAYAQRTLAAFDHPVRKLDPQMIPEDILRFSNGYLAYPPLGVEEAADSSIRPARDLSHHIRALREFNFGEYTAAEQGEALVSPLAPRHQTIGLCMIVRNEAAVIERCIESVRHLIDTWVICDTGSTDGTPEIIERTLSGLPGQLYHHPWRDFGSNRTAALELARGSADYLLLLDADMVVHHVAPLPELTADAYLVEYEGDLGYAVPRLIRSDRRWLYVGATHEYLWSDTDVASEHLGALSIIHHGDGGSKEDKFLRDLLVLEEELHADPDNSRTVFYLAQTYFDLGNHARAAELYARRAQMGGWDQEVFYAAYRHAAITAATDWERGLALLFASWELMPSRVEPLYEIAVRARERGQYRLARLVAEVGRGIPEPSNGLFVHRWLHKWGMTFELAAACGWLDEHTDAVRLNDELLADPSIPDGVAESALYNRIWSAERLQAAGVTVPPPGRRPPATDVAHLSDLVEGVCVRELEVSHDGGWWATNPSVAHHDGAVSAIVRLVNYELRGSRYVVADGGPFRTVNHLAQLGPELTVCSSRELDEHELPAREATRVIGFEDCRLIWWRERWWASATSRDTTRDELCHVVLLELNGDKVVHARPLVGPDPGRHEKNWMPFVNGDDLLFVYTANPLVVLRVADDGQMEQVASHPPRADWPVDLRGGSQGTRVEGGWLFVVHESRRAQLGGHYQHRLLRIDERYGPSDLSRPFSFLGEGVEFCCGAAVQEDRLILSVGVADRRAVVVDLQLDEALSLLGDPHRSDPQ